jgi:hypothetical protein
MRAKGRRFAEWRAALPAECARSRRAWMASIAARAAIAEQVLDDQSHDQGEQQKPEQTVEKEESWKESRDADEVHGDLPCSSGL